MKTTLQHAQLARFALTPQQLDLLQKDYDELVDLHMNRPATNVVGVAVTEYRTANCHCDRPALLLLLKKGELDPRKLYGDRSTHGWRIITQVVGKGKFFHAADAAVAESPGLLGAGFTSQYRPVPGGASVGPLDGDTGTVGCQVKVGSKTYMLSNNHVLASLSKLPIGTPIIQPGAADAKGHPSPVAKLSGYTAMSPTAAQNIDAAIAAYDHEKDVDCRLMGNHGTFYSLAFPIATAEPKDEVQKSGRTTGYTTGTVHATGTTVEIEDDDGNEYRFCNVILIANETGQFADHGDSGSVVSTFKGNHPVGLLFGGAGDLVYVQPMQEVLAALKTVMGSEVTIRYE